MTRKNEQKAPAKTRKEAVAITIKGIRGKVPMIKSLKKLGMNEKGNNLNAKVDTRIKCHI